LFTFWLKEKLMTNINKSRFIYLISMNIFTT
jgi:hypothetical protein